MTKETLINLLENKTKISNSTKGIDPFWKPMIVACGLWFPGGEPHKTLEDTFHILKSSSKRAVSSNSSVIVWSTRYQLTNTAPIKQLHSCILALMDFCLQDKNQMLGMTLITSTAITKRLSVWLYKWQSITHFCFEMSVLQCLDKEMTAEHIGDVRNYDSAINT
jgi:hypothetical protein